MSAPGAGTQRFPRFGAEYRRRWIDKGLWADRTLHDLFDDTVAARGGDTAVVTKDRRVTFAEWKAESDALAAGLLGAGVGAGDLVGVQLPNWPEFCELQIALSRIGAVISPLHVVYREREMRSLLDFCETDVLVVPGPPGDPDHGHDHAVAARAIRGDLRRLRLLVVARGEAVPAAAGAETTLEALKADGRAHPGRLGGLASDPDAVFYLNFTSGTEGAPKGFLHTHNTLISTFRTMATLMAQLEPDMVQLACSPMTHSFGHFMTYFTAIGGVPVVLVDRYRPGDVLELVARERVTSLSGTPAHIIGVLHHPDFARYDTSSVKNCSVGGARSAPELVAELERVWGIRSQNTYGMGENVVHTRTMPFDPEDKARESVGRPLFGAEVKVVDPVDHTRALPAGEVGEICFRGPTLFVGYYRQAELTAATRDADGWFFTGDLGSLDAEGYLYFAGRAKEVVNRGGTKIYPKEIEDLLNALPEVADAAVVAWPDDRLGETVCAYVVPAEGAEVTLEGVASGLEAARAMRYLVPERIVVVGELPMTPTGKVRKASLMADAALRAKGDAPAVAGTVQERAR